MDFGKRLTVVRGSPWAASTLACTSLLFGAAAVRGIVIGDPGNAALCAIAAVCMAVIPFARWRQSVEVFERGMVWHRVYGSRALAVDAITKVELTRLRVSSGACDQLAIERARGRVLKIRGLLAAGEVRNLLLARMQANLDASFTPAAAQDLSGWQPPRASNRG
jgi:hypothetical protein